MNQDDEVAMAKRDAEWTARGKDASACFTSISAGIVITSADFIKDLKSFGIRQFHNDPSGVMSLDWHVGMSQSMGVAFLITGLYVGGCILSAILRFVALKTPLPCVPGMLARLSWRLFRWSIRSLNARINAGGHHDG